MDKRKQQNAGFTLAELLVATTITAIVMTAVYSSFSSLTTMWRAGNGDDTAYQEARIALSLFEREVQSHVPGAAHLFEGTNDTFMFYAVVPTMNVDEGPESRLLQIEYDLRRGTGDNGAQLVRKEAIVTSRLPIQEEGTFAEDEARVETDREIRFDLVRRVKDFEISYWRVPQPKSHDTVDGKVYEAVDPVIFERLEPGEGMPQAMQIRLTVEHADSESGQKTFETFIVFRGPTEPFEQDESLGEGGTTL